MKPISQKVNKRKSIIVPCCFCKQELKRNKSYLKKHPLSYCSEECKVYYKDPKQYDIMKHNNTQNFSYLIGLLLTDGHIAYPNATKTSKTYYAMIRLKNDDGDLILPKIQNIFGGKVYHEITNGFEYKHKSTCWRVSNKEFIQFLISIGFTNNKTYSIDIKTWFDTLNDDNKKSFIRGCWDGDGSVNIYERSIGNTKQLTNHICSASQPFINLVVNYFAPNGNLFERTKDKNKKATCSLWYFSLNGNNSQYLEKIYGNINLIDDLVIKRKYESWLQIKNYLENIHINRLYSSTLYGVMLNKIDNKWHGVIKNNYKNYDLGSYDNETGAAIAYDIATIYFNKSTHRINYVEKIDEYKKLIKHNLLTGSVLKSKMPVLVNLVLNQVN